MKRTQFYLPQEMYQELALEAKKEAKKVAEIVRELLSESLRTRKAKTKTNVFVQLAKIAKVGPKNLSATYKEYLFGKTSKWGRA